MKTEQKHKRLTKEQMKSCAGFENISDEEAENNISILERISILFYEIFMRKKSESKKVTPLKNGNDESKSRIAA